MDNEVMELIDQLYTMVSEAWGVPLGNEKCIVERDQVLEILDEIKTAMPVELSEAKRLVSARDEFINNAKREAEGIRNQAEERARALVDDQEIVRIAKARSNEMLASTQGLGYMIQIGRSLSRPEIIIVGMAVIGVTGAIMSGLLSLCEKKVAPWRYK